MRHLTEQEKKNARRKRVLRNSELLTIITQLATAVGGGFVHICDEKGLYLETRLVPVIDLVDVKED